MDHTLEELTRFVKGKDTRLACAAAVVLTELAPKDAGVCEALIHALNGEPARRSFVIEALGRIGTHEAAEALVPLIQAGGPSSDDALRAIAHAGSGVLKPMVKALASAPPAVQPKLAEAIARTGELQGFQALFSEWTEPALRPALKTGLRNALPSLSPKGREALVKQVEKSLETKALLNDEAALAEALALAGEIGEPELLSSLTPFVKESQPPVVLAAALHGIGKLKLEPAKRGKLAEKLIPFLQSTDYRHHAEPALSALREAELDSSLRSALQKLVGSPRRDVREFAMKALAGQGGSRALGELLECLTSPDRQMRDDAARALEKAPGAAEPVAKMLLDCENGDQSRDLSHVLTKIAAHIPDGMVNKLANEYVLLASGKAELRKSEGPHDDPRRDADLKRSALLAVLRATNSEVLAEQALKYARKLRQADDMFGSVGLLKSIIGLPGWSAEHKLELAFCGLSHTPSDFSRASRERDTNLTLISEALGSNAVAPKQLVKTLMQDDTLSRKALYYVGFHFCERMLGERDFGHEILLKLSEKNNEEGKMAKEKLMLEGFLKSSGKQKKSLLEQRAEALRAADDIKAKADAIELLREREAQERAKADKRKMAQSMKTGGLKTKLPKAPPPKPVIIKKAAKKKKK
jgi:hypothetical protein